MIISLLTNQVLREVGAIARCVQSVSDIRFKQISLQRGQFIFVTRIYENPGINQIELSNLLKVDKGTTTKAIQKLIDEGYLYRERSQIDKRAWLLYPTNKAKEVYPYIIQEENRNLASCFRGFDAQEVDLVYLLLKRMRENIEQDWISLRQNKEED